METSQLSPACTGRDAKILDTDVKILLRSFSNILFVYPVYTRFHIPLQFQSTHQHIMVHVKAHKNPTFAIISEKYLQDILASIDKNNIKQARARIESALTKLKDAQEGNKAPRQLTEYQKFSNNNFQKVKEELKEELMKETGKTDVEPKFEHISMRIGKMWAQEKEKKKEKENGTEK